MIGLSDISGKLNSLVYAPQISFSPGIVGSIGAVGVKEQGFTPDLPGADRFEFKAEWEKELEAVKNLQKAEECTTCSDRKYVDGSDDGAVSFQAPTEVDPMSAKDAVMSHEREHVFREQADAKEEGREIIRQSVAMHYDTCPECGKMYASGGLTTTKSKKEAEQEYSNNKGQTSGQISGQDTPRLSLYL